METINIRLAMFEGPLDLLYHLIEKNEIDIYDIPIAALTEQYLAYLDAAEDRDMDGMSEFLLMAATLPDVTRILDLSAEDGERLKKAAGVLSPEELIYFIGKFSDLQSEMKWATNERILLEVNLMKL